MRCCGLIFLIFNQMVMKIVVTTTYQFRTPNLFQKKLFVTGQQSALLWWGTLLHLWITLVGLQAIRNPFAVAEVFDCVNRKSHPTDGNKFGVECFNRSYTRVCWNSLMASWHLLVNEKKEEKVIFQNFIDISLWYTVICILSTMHGLKTKPAD